MPGIDGNTPKAYSGGTWKDWAAVQGKLDGTWRLASDVYMKSGGVWKRVWVRLTAPTAGTSSINHVTATISWTAGVGQEGFKLYRDGVFIKNVTGTSTTDVVPAMQTNYVYTVSAYAGTTETAQIACGTVSAQVPNVTSTANLERNWNYINDTWDGQYFLFRHGITAPAANATGYNYSIDNGANVYSSAISWPITQAMNPGATAQVIWRAYIVYNSVTYYGAWSNVTTVYSGLPQVRTAQNDDIPFDAWGDQERYYTAFGEFTSLGAGYASVGIPVDYYQFRNLTINFGSQITSSTRSITINRPGADIVLSGTPYVSNGWDSDQYTNYVDFTFRVNPSGSGWFNYANANKLSGVVRFRVRPITQAAVSYTIT